MTYLLILILNFDASRAAVWGTIANWVEIIVYTATLIALLYTLREQRRTTRLQQEQFRINSRPYFDLQRTTTINQGGVFDLIFIQIVNGNPAYDLTMNGTDNFRIHRDKILAIPPGLKIDVFLGKWTGIHQEIEVYVYFSDENHNCYEQLIHGDINDLVMNPPRLIERAK